MQDLVRLPRQQIDLVVAGRACERRPKYQFAAVSGCAAVKPEWLDTSVRAGQALPQEGDLVWRGPSEPACPFQGLHVWLHGQHEFVNDYAALLPHAGVHHASE